ncbi:hypothetical protein NDU88_000851 [Pleurodeles waltl]|uniref:Secreted protein n=1 Tax=Pleurodeles waltl TaxID=8319 RepID=A0AAV7NAX2_PLEWA|nr:hypothetical protein NDU88_000851 [Pleurodeles waltl]
MLIFVFLLFCPAVIRPRPSRRAEDGTKAELTGRARPASKGLCRRWTRGGPFEGTTGKFKREGGVCRRIRTRRARKRGGEDEFLCARCKECLNPACVLPQWRNKGPGSAGKGGGRATERP